MRSTITLSGLDERLSRADLDQLLRYPRLELGLLYTHSPDGRPRYPAAHWLAWVAQHAAGRCAVHICGGRARAALLAGELDDLLAPAARIQINGLLSSEEAARVCERYAHHTVITQHHERNAHLVDLPAANHALLVDASGGAGLRPERWCRPASAKVVGFVGGLGPHNLAEQLPEIAAIAGDGPWWVDMENQLRVDDWFNLERAQAVLAAHAQQP